MFGTSAATFNDDGVTALYQHLRELLAERGLSARPGRPAPGRRYVTPAGAAQIVPPSRARYLAEIAETVRDVPRAHRATRPRPARRVQRLSAVRDELAELPASAGEVDRLLGDARERLDEGARRALERWPRTVRGLQRRRAGGDRARPGSAHPPGARVTVRQPDPAGGAAALRRPRGAAAVPARGEPARLVPVHRRGVPVQAGGRGPGPDVRRRGRPVPHQPAVQAARPRAARRPGCPRRSTRSPSTAATRPSGPTSTARSAPRASRSRRWTT